jgi:hypothetical protein
LTDTTGKSILVHKQDSDGTISLDYLTGQVTTPNDERPEWAEGLATALLAERTGYYAKRLGSAYPPELATADAMAFEDLGWIGHKVDDGGEGIEYELSASEEYRMDCLAKFIGVDRADFDSETPFQNAVAEAHIANDTRRTPLEVMALDDAAAEGFRMVPATTEAARTGTEG